MIFPQLPLLSLPLAQLAFDNSRFDNVATYWGQNSYGAANPGDESNWQQPLEFYCQNTDVNVYPVGFVTTTSSTGGVPEINLSNACSGPYFPGTALLNCQFMASQISACQAQGKLITISIGGATAHISFSTDNEAVQFADSIWNIFLGGSSTTRPFGDAVLDGVDIDVEVPDPNNVRWAVFVNRLRSHFDGASKNYYVTAAPQCPFPDQSLGNGLNAAVFDAIYVQFYNNFCGIDTFNTSNFNFGTWDYWARRQSQNPETKIFLGVPGSSTAAGRGYRPIGEVNEIATTLRGRFPSFGGVMIWDISQSYMNNEFEGAIKEALVEAGGTGFTYPPCDAPQFVNGNAYLQGDRVTYDDYIWEAKWWTNIIPSSDISDVGTWVVISACSDDSAGAKSPQQSDVFAAEMEAIEKLQSEGLVWTIKSWITPFAKAKSRPGPSRTTVKNKGKGRFSRVGGRVRA